jgi:hypothetical protein
MKPDAIGNETKKRAITIDTKYDNRNNDLGKGVMILLGYIPYVST